MKQRAWLWFLAINSLVALLVFGRALWGGALLAPLDFAPTTLAKYRFVDSQAGATPDNQFVMDQLLYDLPLQYTLHDAYRRGEMPWWDPYTAGGRPLLADAHVNGTDPVRVLLYLLLPFELAYNWTYVLHCLLGGMGMFLLLRRWEFPSPICVWFGVTATYAGWQALFVGHPWVSGALLYYPYLWLVLDAATELPRAWHWIAAPLGVAAILYAGNLQSHLYLAVFALVFAVGYLPQERASRKRFLFRLAGVFLIGACLAAPVLFNQVELFLLSTREVVVERATASWLAGPASLSALFPWAMGTFHSLDLARFFGKQSNLGFALFIGCAAFALALAGAVVPGLPPEAARRRRTALGLVLVYIVVMATPARSFLYMRSAALAVLGLIPLAAFGLRALLSDTRCWRRSGWAITVGTVALVVALHVAALMVYPRFVPRIRELVHRRAAGSATALEADSALRDRQIASLPTEVTFANPETVLGCLSLLALATVMFRPGLRQRSWTPHALLALNLVPLLHFYERFIPAHDIELWRRLVNGGPEQVRLMALPSANSVRLLEEAPAAHDLLLPYNFAHFYRVRAIGSYSALQPPSAYFLPDEQKARWLRSLADYVYTTDARGDAGGRLRKVESPGLARLQWLSPSRRRFEIERDSLCEIRLRFEAGEAAEFLWNDTRYPGWSVHTDTGPLASAPAEPCFNQIRIPPEACRVVFRYEPTYYRRGLCVAGFGCLLLVAGALANRLRGRATGNS